jgi:hypothetical protein
MDMIVFPAGKGHQTVAHWPAGLRTQQLQIFRYSSTSAHPLDPVQYGANGLLNP